MKIGLLTFHDTNNFGSYLQTYGLYKKVVDLEYDCEIIDYQCKSIIEREQFGRERLTFSVRQILKEIFINRQLRIKYKNLKSWLLTNAKVGRSYNKSNIKESCSQYSKFLVGSDIVWGMDIIGKDTTYFLDFENDSSKKLAFSSSIGNPWTEEDKNIIKPYLKEFNGIAVREEESAEWVRDLIGIRPNVVCDPTMLLKSNEWTMQISEKYKGRNYVLVYFPTPANIQDAQKYAKQHGLECYLINHGLPVKGFKSVRPLNIGDFLSLFYYAGFVFSASYHGVLFSIYFNRQFAYYNRAHKSRMNTLACKLNVKDRNGLEYDVLQMKPIDYEKVNKAVEEYRNYSINCLKELLEK